MEDDVTLEAEVTQAQYRHAGRRVHSSLVSSGSSMKTNWDIYDSSKKLVAADTYNRLEAYRLQDTGQKISRSGRLRMDTGALAQDSEGTSEFARGKKK
jgi:hypothetical protein